MTVIPARTSDAASRLALLSVLGALAVFVVYQVMGLVGTQGAFDYPLDDTYIHLAMAEQIARGGYGINVGEYTSAASSPIFPFLLAVAPATELQRILPLLWNTVALVAAAWIWGILLIRAGFGEARLRPLGIVLALGGPLVLNMAGAAFVGMEHGLHVAASLAILFGLIVVAEDDRTPWWLLVIIGVAPLLRLEGLALSLVAAGCLTLQRGWATGLVAGALAVIPVFAFMGFLSSLGLPPLPNSVVVKLGEGGAALDTGPLRSFLLTVRSPVGAVLLALCLVLLLISAGRLAIVPSRLRLLALGVAAAGLAHLAFGKIGWMHRYEIYIYATLAAALIYLAGKVEARSILLGGVALVTFLGLGYAGDFVRTYAPYGPRGIHFQQGEMARFARDFWKAPVAVNDIGWVAWSNPSHVLDLWGLASTEAMTIRADTPEPGWADPLVKRSGAGLAMIYDNWLGEAVGSDWVKLGELRSLQERGFLGGIAVSFYATDPKYVAALAERLDTFAATMTPGRSEFVFEPGARN